MTDDESPQKKGGRARAEALSADERADIARRGALARWRGNTPKATHSGELSIAGVQIPCAVLEDGTRVLSEFGITNALLGSRSGASKRLKRASQAHGAPVPLFLAPGNLKPFIANDLANGALDPLSYRVGSRLVSGFNAEILPAVCDIWLRAREAGALQPQQLDKAKKAEILMRGLARIGITALVDEATGYQEVRDRQALQAILDRFLSAELAAWAKRFPDEFYDELFRLRGWQWERKGSRRPVQVAKDTINLVYMRMVPDLLKELEIRNPKDEKGRRRAKHHQLFSVDMGSPALNAHVHAVLSLMRAFDTWDEFKGRLDRALPVVTRLSDLPLFSQPVATIEPPRPALQLPSAEQEKAS